MGTFHDTITVPARQAELDDSNSIEVLLDKSSTGRERPWRAKKMANEALAEAYEPVNPRKAERLLECGNFLSFSVLEDGSKKLKTMCSCRVRLCPICTWRRSMKVQSHTLTILNAVNDKYAYLFLTLTVRNCSGEELSGTLDLMMDAWQRLSQRKQFKSAVKGWYRGLEVTHNTDRDSPSFDTYHPHFHVILAVNPSYFTSRNYVKQDEWMQLWKKSLRADYDPVVDVRRVKGCTAKAVAEAAKYSTKEEDYIVPSDWELTVETVRTLDVALDQRKLVAYGGIMKQLHKQLNLDDEETGDLINVDPEDSTAAPTERVESYFWNTGYRQYVRHS